MPKGDGTGPIGQGHATGRFGEKSKAGHIDGSGAGQDGIAASLLAMTTFWLWLCRNVMPQLSYTNKFEPTRHWNSVIVNRSGSRTAPTKFVIIRANPWFFSSIFDYGYVALYESVKTCPEPAEG